MTQLPHTRILKRTGGVLLAVGLIDVAVMVYCMANRIAYSSSFNLFAVVAGIFLLRGSLRAASVVRWLSVLMLSAFLTLLVAWPFMQPLDLTLTQLRLSPRASIQSAAFMAFVLALLLWLSRELGRAPIQAARTEAGRKTRDMRIPAAVGVGLVSIMGVLSALLLGGDSATRAMSIAEQQVGPGYRYHVSSLNIAKSNQGTIVSGVVTAWNEKEIKNIPVRWEER